MTADADLHIPQRVALDALRMCSIPGCSRPLLARGWCSLHYQRWRTKGDPTSLKDVVTPSALRFWAKVNKDGPIPTARPDLGHCWLWTGGIDSWGYGRFNDGLEPNRRGYKAHRWIYEREVGLIPGGLTIDHLCRTAACVRPTHLEVVTCRENILRGTGPSAQVARRDCCNQGHPYDLINTIWRPGGARRCRICRSEYMKERRRRARTGAVVGAESR